VCEIPKPFQTMAPISKAVNGALIEEAKKVAAEFQYGDDEVIKGVKHFVEQMSTLLHLYLVKKHVWG
jgi:hypothetical protein